MTKKEVIQKIIEVFYNNSAKLYVAIDCSDKRKVLAYQGSSGFDLSSFLDNRQYLTLNLSGEACNRLQYFDTDETEGMSVTVRMRGKVVDVHIPFDQIKVLWDADTSRNAFVFIGDEITIDSKIDQSLYSEAIYAVIDYMAPVMRVGTEQLIPKEHQKLIVEFTPVKLAEIQKYLRVLEIDLHIRMSNGSTERDVIYTIHYDSEIKVDATFVTFSTEQGYKTFHISEFEDFVISAYTEPDADGVAAVYTSSDGMLVIQSKDLTTSLLKESSQSTIGDKVNLSNIAEIIKFPKPPALSVFTPEEETTGGNVVDFNEFKRLKESRKG